VLGIILIPSLIARISDTLRKPGDELLGQHLSAAAHSAGRNFVQAAFTLACLPYEAFLSLDAIARTTGRMLVTHKRLLEWSPSSDSDHRDRASLATSFQTMWIAPAIAVTAAIYLALTGPAVSGIAAPILGLWLTSPAIAWWISRPLARRQTGLTADQTVFLRKLSRKTWAFFETFVGPEDHWLPPDDYQEHPVAVVGHRTSPTNMGLALLANLSAYDFGYIPAGQLIERTANALHTMETLGRFRGHFYNWYDTQSLQPLPPLYVSTVDSGNLAGHLLTLRAGLDALPGHKVLGTRLYEGLGDTLRIVVEAAGQAASAPLAQLQEELASACKLPATLPAPRPYLERLAEAAKRLDVPPESQARWWANALERQCLGALGEMTFLSGLESSAVLSEAPTLRELAGLATEAGRRARARIVVIEQLAQLAGELAQMEYDFLFDKGRHLLSIGYNAGERRRDSSYYDLLASEARLCSFVAIAQGQVPQEAWFALGRLLVAAGGEPVLLSWSGSMFEYLMPLLVMPTYENTLLDQTCRAAVRRQIEYGRKRGVPWGISECCYNATDVHLNYQYRAFGVPGLGLKRGLADELVVAPYASALALMVAPEEACLNLQRLTAEGFEGKFGLYEAIDYTPSRLPRGQSSAVVRAFLVHHEGMSLLSLAYLLLDRPMQKRFESDPLFQATTLLLQERVPKATASYSQTAESSGLRESPEAAETPMRVFSSPDSAVPEVQLLSNGRYHVMITNAGGGYSRWKDLAVTRWREDTTCDNWGTFCYIR
ncbi:MAG: glucoamylase family protein, partial [Bryobacteraceae bacterium]